MTTSAARTARPPLDGMTIGASAPTRQRVSLALAPGIVALLLLTGCSAVSGNEGAALAEVAAAGETQVGTGDSSALLVDSPAPTLPIRPEVEIPTDWDSDVEELFGRYWLYWEAFAAAYGPPFADPTFAPLRTLSTPENWASLRTQLEGFAEDGVVLVLPEVSTTEHLIRIPNATVFGTEEGAEAIIQDCWIDDFTQQTLSGEVIAETKEAKLMNVTMKISDGTWRVHGVTRAAPDADGYDQCLALSPR